MFLTLKKVYLFFWEYYLCKLKGLLHKKIIFRGKKYHFLGFRALFPTFQPGLMKKWQSFKNKAPTFPTATPTLSPQLHPTFLWPPGLHKIFFGSYPNENYKIWLLDIYYNYNENHSTF